MADVKNYMVGNDQNTINQVNVFAESAAYKDSKIRIMPDAHAGKGAVVGSTITYTDKIVPATVGVDIACRVSAFPIDKKDIDFDKLDKITREFIPTGFKVREHSHGFSYSIQYENLYCWEHLVNHERLRKSLGTLGGGNHFIEVDYDSDNDKYWLVVHCGSRNLGKQVAEYYQDIAVKNCLWRIQTYVFAKETDIQFLREAGCTDRIQQTVDHWNTVINAEPADDLCYLEGEDMQHYLNDMRICNEFSYMSHMAIAYDINYKMGWHIDFDNFITCIHNYVDVDHNIIRKGAIEAYEGQLGLIPLNMRDGMLIVKALGNEDWNCSLPHGAGRVMSRGEARRQLSLSDFQKAMEGINSSSVRNSTIDEAPMAYKDAAAIIEAIKPNAEIIAHMYPCWNYKAC